MLYNKQVAFHPDTPIADYVSIETGKPTFAAPKTLQKDLNRFFKICNKRDVDIYTLTLPIYKVYLRRELGIAA